MSALGLADKLLAEFGTLPALAEASIEELSSIPGIVKRKPFGFPLHVN